MYIMMLTALAVIGIDDIAVDIVAMVMVVRVERKAFDRITE